MFGFEAIIPTEVGLPTLKMDIAELTSENELQLAQNLDLIKETRDIAALQIEKYQKMVQQFHATKVWPRKFQEGD